MPARHRWDRCVAHRDPDVRKFIEEYFRGADRRVAVIAAAGFDPRSAVVCRLLSESAKDIRAVLVREERPDPAPELVTRAAENLSKIEALVPKKRVVSVPVFGEKNAVVGGRNIVKELAKETFDGVTDVVVDSSALSIGVGFPLITYLDARVRHSGTPRNLHVFVALDAGLDNSIKPVASDTASLVHGLKGGLGLEAHAQAKKLWMPQLARGRRQILQKIREYVGKIHDTCPILPFPASNPRLGDDLAEEFVTEFEDDWEVDTRNIVYAAENDPLDLYRTILRIDDLRRSIFEDLGGSKLILSPVGSKVLALGALMAAIERDLPVVYLESLGYECDSLPPSAPEDPDVELIHVWLAGEVYS
ncbi:MAG: hypothetical protein ACYC3W_07830 [Candidatus Nanopelagicales bacterium]